MANFFLKETAILPPNDKLDTDVTRRFVTYYTHALVTIFSWFEEALGMSHRTICLEPIYTCTLVIISGQIDTFVSQLVYTLHRFRRLKRQ